MRETRAIGRKGLIGVICSLLMVFQPVFGAQSPSAAGAVASGGQIRGSGLPALLGTSVDAMLVALLSLSHPELGRDSELIAVAKLTGTAERNGRPLLNGSIVSSGDFLSTHADSALLLTSTPEERLWLGPDTSAKLTKDGENVGVALERGTLGFETRGHIEVSFEQHEGLAIRSPSGSLALAQLTFVNNEEAQVRVEQGSLELVQGDQSVLLQPEHARLISVTDARSPAEPQPKGDSGAQAGPATELNTGSIKGTVVGTKLFVVSGANVALTDTSGNTLTTITDQQGNFTFTKVPVGTYTLSVVHPGFPNYESHDVVVSSGKESSVYVELAAGGGGGNKHTGLIIGVVAGVGAAAGIGAALAASKGSSTSTVSSTQ
jgi:Carboxypeptidase regulatory-like domain